MIVPLHNHSDRSAIDGVSTPKEIARRVITEMGCPCCGLTDHGVVAGHLEFDKEIRKAGGKPIFGCELYHGLVTSGKMPPRDQAHLIALAMTDAGLRNLWCLVDAAAQEDHAHHVDRVFWDDIEKFHEGIVFTSACAGGLVPQGLLQGNYEALNRYLEICKDDFYIELPTYPGDAMMMDKDLDEPVLMSDLVNLLMDVAQERGIPVVPGDDGHYAFPEQWRMHDAYIAKGTKQSIFTPIEERKMWHPPGALCIKTEDQVRAALSYLPDSVVDEAIANSVALGERADAHLPEVRRHLPVFIPDDCPWIEEGEYSSGAQLFIDLVEEGIEKRYGPDVPDHVWDRALRETEVFLDEEAHLYDYFLIAWDVMQFCANAPESPIETGPGRGSSAGCIVAYALGITDVDPLPYDLIFERFWNPGRAKGFPDIDSDFQQKRRKEVKEYLARRYGHDKVRSIGNVIRLQPKAVIDAFAIACGVTFEEANALKKIVSETPDIDILGADQIGWSPAFEEGKIIYVESAVGDKIVDWISEQRPDRHEILANFVDLCAHLCNRVSSYGVHASGIVISDEPLPGIAPCRFAKSKEQRIPVTQFAMDDIDALLLIKFDALGLRTLDVLADWKRQMKEDHGIEIDWSGLEWEEQDPGMWKLLEDGFGAGIFQIEGGMAQHICKEFAPKSVSDLSIIVALNRPGPLRTGAPESFIKRRRGEEETTFDHPFLESLLDQTYGWFLYQEQVIRFFSKLGYSDSDADAVRKILGKKQPEKWLALFKGSDEWEDKGYIEMAAKSDLGDLANTQAAEWDGQDVEDDYGKPLYPDVEQAAWIIWRKIVNFGKYSFNKSHSVAYGTIGFRCDYAKYWGPIEFYQSGIRNVDQNKKAERIPPFVNEARRLGIKVYPPDIERSKAIAGSYDGDTYLGFSDIKDIGIETGEFLVKLRTAGVPMSTPEELFESMEKLTKVHEAENRRRKKAGEEKQKGKSPKQLLRSNQITNLVAAGCWDRLEPDKAMGLRDRQNVEKELLNVILSDNVAEAYANNIEDIDKCDLYSEALEEYTQDERFHLPGVVTHIKETKVRATGKKMGIVTIEHDGQTLEFAVFPREWRSHRMLWNERTPGIFTIEHSWNEKAQKDGYHFETGYKLN